MTDQPPFIIDEIHQKTKEAVLGAQSSLTQKVVDRLAAAAITERAELLFAGVKKYDELRKDVAKASKPDSVTEQRNADGTWGKVEQFTPAGAKRLRDAEEKLTKFKTAYAKALDPEKPDYEPLKKLLGGAVESAEG